MRILWLFLLCYSSLLATDATLDIVKTIGKLPKVAIFYQNTDPYLKKIARLLASDLKISGHFEVMGAPQIQTQTPSYDSLATKGIQILVEIKADQNHQIHATLYDIANRSIKASKDYEFNTKALYPFIAHRVAIDTNALIQAPSIAWMQRMVVFAKYLSPGVTSIVVADYTLSYQQEIIKNNLLNIFPKWANADQSAIYFTQYLREPTIIKYDIRTGKSEAITQSSGMAAVSSVSKNGDKLLLSLAPDGQTDIFFYDTLKKSLKRLTTYSGIDVMGTFVDNEKAMVFVSDRSGYPNIYLKKLRENAPVEQVVFYAKNNDSITASGDNIVYVSREDKDANGQSTFNLHLITLKSDYVRRLTVSGVNQMPRFSYDGKAVMFLKKAASQSALGVILLDSNQSYLFPLENLEIQSFDW